MLEIWKNLEWVLPLRSDCLTPIMESFTLLGESLFLFYFLSLGFWIWRKESFRRLIILGFISFLVNIFLKNLVQDPRPDVKYHLVEAIGYGFPSGHAQIAMTSWIALAIEINRPLAWIICSFIAFGLSFSRIYLGVHDPEDVISGLAIGGAILFLFYRFKAALYQWGKQFSLPVQLFVIWGLTGMILLACPGEIGSYLVYSCGLLAAQSTGLILEAHYIQFSISGLLFKRIVGGFMGLMIISSIVLAYQGYFLGAKEIPLLVVFLYTTIISLWQTYLIPNLFARYGLADRKKTL